MSARILQQTGHSFVVVLHGRLRHSARMRFRRALAIETTPETTDDGPRLRAWDGIAATPGASVVIHAARAGEVTQHASAA